jgi:NADH:ubiquinone oxidoreductase subunit C
MYQYIRFTHNVKKKHKEPEKFNDQDTQLLDVISTLNTRSKEINKRLQTCSPNWSRDLYSNTKHRSRIRILYNLNLYEDGLHPKPLLAKVWLRKLAQHIKSHCWIWTSSLESSTKHRSLVPLVGVEPTTLAYLKYIGIYILSTWCGINHVSIS